MPTSTAVVVTDAAARYARQLLAHLGRKNTVEELEGEPGGGLLVFPYGRASVRPAEGHLLLTASAADGDSLDRLEDVLGRHLVRFGARAELAVTWQREQAGTTDE